MRESLSYICSEKDCEAVGSSFMAELLLILSFLFNLFLTILLHVFILNLVNWSGELVRQAERKFRTSTRIPDLDNANVGTNAREQRSREKPMASPVFLSQSFKPAIYILQIYTGNNWDWTSIMSSWRGAPPRVHFFVDFFFCRNDLDCITSRNLSGWDSNRKLTTEYRAEKEIYEKWT